MGEESKNMVAAPRRGAMLWRVLRKLPRLTLLKRQEPVFIVGCGRSGTTMLLSILSADPKLYCVSEETECFARLKSGSRLALRMRLLSLFWRILKQDTPIRDQVRYVEKTPRHVRDIDLIRKAYCGRVRLIHLVRDGRDVITSHHPSGGERAFHIDAERWIREVSLGAEHVNQPYMFTLRYEDIILDFDNMMAKLYEFLGQSLPGEARDFSKHATVREHWAWPGQVRSLSAESIGRWKQADLSERVETLTSSPAGQALLKQFGYE